MQDLSDGRCEYVGGEMRPEDLPEETLLIQLAEEAVELSQACIKLYRAMHGDTPVSEADARDQFMKEISIPKHEKYITEDQVRRLARK